MWENLKPHHTPSSEHPSYAPVPHTELAVVSPPPSQVYSSNRGEREVKHINLNGQILWSRQKKKSTHVLNHLQLVCTFPGVGRKDGVKRSPRINEISRSLYLLKVQIIYIWNCEESTRHCHVCTGNKEVSFQGSLICGTSESATDSLRADGDISRPFFFGMGSFV